MSVCWYPHPSPFSDLLLLASNWSTMGDSFFVCHHLAALYAYGYVLVCIVIQYGMSELMITRMFLLQIIFFYYFHVLLISAFRSNVIDTWGASIFRKLPTYFGIINTICEPKVRNSLKWAAVVIIFWVLLLTYTFFLQVVLWVAGIPSLSPPGGG